MTVCIGALCEGGKSVVVAADKMDCVGYPSASAASRGK
jgi:hypothetical protein